MIRFYLGHLENRQRLYREFVADADRGQPCLFLVPEQFTVHAEHRLMQLRPQGFGGQAEVVSFKRLARRIMIACGRSLSHQPDAAVCSVVMLRAFMKLRDSLQFYASARVTPGFVAQLCRAEEQMRRSCISPEELESAAQTMGARRRKLEELARIVGQYRVMMEEGAFAHDEQEQAAALLDETSVFDGYRIYVDGFYYFSAAELDLLSRLMKHSDITLALPADPRHAESERESVFARPAKTMAQLRRLAQRCGVSVEAVRIEEEEEPNALSHLRRYLFLPNAPAFEGDTDALCLHAAADCFDEAEQVAIRIAKLRREGYRDGEIAVLCRDESRYKGVLDSVLEMHGISVFTDKRTHIAVKPLALLLSTALDIAADDFTTEDVLTHIKTGLTALDDEALGRMQRYCAVWEPLPGQWKKDFADNPDGFAVEMTEEAQLRLDGLNADRRRIIDPILRLKQALTGTVADVCRALYEYMESVGVAERLKEQTVRLDAQGDHAQAQECEQTWEILGKVLSALYEAAGDMPTDPDLFRQLWACALAGYDIGRIPTSVDEVLTGRVDHVRTIGRRAVFVMGVNAGSFPAHATENDLVNAGDRDCLRTAGLDWEDNMADGRDEWFYAYLAFGMPTEKLFVSYHQLTDTHDPAMASEFFDQIRALFPQVPVTHGHDGVWDCPSAFDQLVSGGFTDEGLLTFFENHPTYRDRLHLAMRAREIGRADVAHSAVLEKRIQGDGLAVSPTSLDTLTGCKFKYFCKYVLRLKPLQRAEMSGRELGTFVHDMMEKVLGQYAKESQIPIWEEDRDRVYALVDDRMKDYLQGYFGGGERSARFRYLFARTKEAVHELIDKLCDEFSQSAFRAEDFELTIGRDGAVSPICIEFEGGSIRVEGTIDRVDSMQTENGRFLRVVDYKTGLKKFDFDDIYNGYAAQMLLYLFSLMQNGGERYGLALRPAGVLYYPARQQFYSVSAGDALPSEEELERQLARQGAQNGLLINDVQVLTAMERELQGRFIDVTIAKGDTLKGNLISERGFAALQEHLVSLLAKLGQELLSGDVTPMPLSRGGDDTACKYCDYAAVCSFEAGRSSVRRYQKYKGSDLERKVVACDE